MNTVNLTGTGISTPVESSNTVIPEQEVTQQKAHDLKLPPQTGQDKVKKTSLMERETSVAATRMTWESQVLQGKKAELVSRAGGPKEQVELALKAFEENFEKVVKHISTDTTTVPQLSSDLEDKLKPLEEHVEEVSEVYQETLEEMQSEEKVVTIGTEEIKSVDTESQQTIDKLDEISKSLREYAKELGGDPDKIRDISKGPRLPGLTRDVTYTYLYNKIEQQSRPKLFWKIACSIFKVPTKVVESSHYDYCHRHIDMLKKFVCHKTEILEDLRGNSERVLNQKAGFVVHLNQNPKEVAIKGFEDYPDLFIQEYEKAKKGGYLVEFFQEAIGGACFPARSRTLEDFAVKHNVELGEVRACTENSDIMDILHEEVGIYAGGKGKDAADELEIYRGFIEQLKQLYGMKDENTFNLKGISTDGGQRELTVQDIKDYWRDIYFEDIE